MRRITYFSALVFLPGILLAHETQAAHLHPHGMEWMPLALGMVVCSLTAYLLIRRKSR